MVDGKAYEKDVVILPEGVRANWWRKKGHLLQAVDLEWVLESKPSVLVVGMGAVSRMKISPGAERLLVQAGIEVLALPTKEACERYNALRLEKRTAAALHLTC
jgi:hypothetical protein